MSSAADIRPASAPAETVAAITPLQQALFQARHHLGLQIGCAILLVAVLSAVFAPWLAPHDPYEPDLTMRLVNPVWAAGGSWDHVLGTDVQGRDVLSRVIYGGRLSLLIGALAALVAGVVGTVVGVTGGYFGGRIDAVMMYFINVKLALPGILISLSLVSVFGGSVTTLVLILGFLFWDRFAIVTRTLTRQFRNRDFIRAAEAIGASRPRIIFGELMPNLASQIIVVASLEMALAILLEAVLSFFGLGLKPPTPSWGILVAEGRSMMFIKPHLIAVPGLAIFLLVMAISMIGDGVRDITSPSRRS